MQRSRWTLYQKPLSIAHLKPQQSQGSSTRLFNGPQTAVYGTLVGGRTITMNAAKRTKRVALYVRVSTDHQSVKNQERELQAVAERHGWQVVAVFKDQGDSGAKGRNGRPGLDKLLQAVARKEVNMVAAWSVD